MMYGFGAFGAFGQFLIGQKAKKPKVETYEYRYQHNPFDGWNSFTVEASTQEEANVLAIAEFKKLFEQGMTAIAVFFPVAKK